MKAAGHPHSYPHFEVGMIADKGERWNTKLSSDPFIFNN